LRRHATRQSVTIPAPHPGVGRSPRFFFDCHKGENRNETTDEHRSTQIKEGKNDAIDWSIHIAVPLHWVFLFSYQCLSVFICGFKRVLPGAGIELSG
jgi:hypothetical protein